jgi:type IV fimbrial biogenesis protein FimT
LLDAKLTADVNGWILAVQLARSEAAKRGRPVIVCPTPDTVSCGGATQRWMVFVNLDDYYPVQRSGGEPLLFVQTAASAGSILSNRSYYEFRPGRRSTNGTIVLCDSRGTASAKAVIVSYTGRPRASNRDANGRPLRCAQLT